jgi:hypothetical protein
MNIGDFFKSAASARPVNPKPVTFTAVSRNEILPGGTPNPQRRQVAASITAALVFIGGDGWLAAREGARKAFADKKQAYDEEDFAIELTYQVLARSLHEWDEKTQFVGAPLFTDAALLRELVETREANRLVRLYKDYVQEEHPEEGPADAATFREA